MLCTVYHMGLVKLFKHFIVYPSFTIKHYDFKYSSMIYLLTNHNKQKLLIQDLFHLVYIFNSDI